MSSGRDTVDFGDLRAEAELAPFAYTNVPETIDDLESGASSFHGVVDVWVFDPTMTRTLLVRHPERGWVMPGGKTEPGEGFRAAAVRELAEEAGVAVDPARLQPAALYLGRDPGIPDIRVGIAFATVIAQGAPVRAAEGMPVAWWSLEDPWDSVYPHDRNRLLRWCRHCAHG